MALADTAKLIASLELQDKFSKTADKFDRTIGGMERRTSTLGRIGAETTRGLGVAAHNLQTIGLVGAGVVAASVAAGIRTLARLEEVTVATNAVIESTGGIAGITAEKVRQLAEKYEGLNAIIDDKVIQSGENLLLTFTKINDKAFEPALQAALDMNQALGGGEEGLQGTIIQVGKALQDPIRGLTALRRVGVNFTKDQQDQIKALVESNDLYGAQQVILAELATEFGGQFAAAGDTATGKFAKLRDAVEDAQAAMATAFLPVLGKVADKLNTLLADPKVLAQIEGFGEGLAGGFEQLVEFAGKLPWEAIGSSLQLAGAGAKAVLSAFTSLPPWVQTAVLTGWGLNKLTGGALGNIVGALGSGLIKGVLGMNAGVVNINAASVTGGIPGAPVAAGGGLRGVIGGVAKFVLGPAAAVIIGSEIAAAINESVIGPARDTEQRKVEAVLASESVGDITHAIDAIADQQNSDDILAQTALIASNIPFIGDALGHVGPKLDEQRRALEGKLTEIHSAAGAASSAANAWSARQMAAFAQVTAAQRTTAGKTGEVAQRVSEARNAINAAGSASNAKLATIAARVDGTSAAVRESGGTLRTIAAKNFSPTVQVKVVSSVTISEIQRKIISQQIAVGKGPLESF